MNRTPDEWKLEIARRVEEIRSDSVELVDGGEVLAAMRQRLRGKYGV